MTAPDLIFFALLAGFVLYRLYRALGKNKFNEQPKPKNDVAKNVSKVAKGQDNPKKNVLQFPGLKKDKTDSKSQRPTETTLDKRRKIQEPEITDHEIAKKLEKIHEVDQNFTAGTFISGAKKAFEIIIESFSKGDAAALKSLLAKDVYKIFNDEIERLKAEKQHRETTLIAVLEGEIADVQVVGQKSRITVGFKTEQISLLKDESGEILQGDPKHIQTIDDTWIFERDPNSENPNWLIIST